MRRARASAEHDPGTRPERQGAQLHAVRTTAFTTCAESITTKISCLRLASDRCHTASTTSFSILPLSSPNPPKSPPTIFSGKSRLRSRPGSVLPIRTANAGVSTTSKAPCRSASPRMRFRKILRSQISVIGTCSTTSSGTKASTTRPTAPGYSSNVMNWNAADAMQANNDSGSSAPFKRLDGGYSQLFLRSFPMVLLYRQPAFCFVLQHASLRARSGDESVSDGEIRFHITERQNCSGSKWEIPSSRFAT